MSDVAIFHNITLPLRAHLSRPFDRCFGLELLEVLDRVDIGPDETFLKISMDNTCSLRRCKALRDGPGAHFLHTGGKVGSQVKQFVSCFN